MSDGHSPSAQPPPSACHTQRSPAAALSARAAAVLGAMLHTAGRIFTPVSHAAPCCTVPRLLARRAGTSDVPSSGTLQHVGQAVEAPRRRRHSKHATSAINASTSAPSTAAMRTRRAAGAAVAAATPAAAATDTPWLIVGLGNPGPRYERTRHNVGFMVVDALARSAGADMRKLEKSAAVGRCTLHGQRLILAKPVTFMNNSGESVAALARFYKARDCFVCPFSPRRGMFTQLRPHLIAAAHRQTNKGDKGVPLSSMPLHRPTPPQSTGDTASAPRPCMFSLLLLINRLPNALTGAHAACAGHSGRPGPAACRSAGAAAWWPRRPQWTAQHHGAPGKHPRFSAHQNWCVAPLSASA
jgi:Peptidyl-tRNA hydrolase